MNLIIVARYERTPAVLDYLTTNKNNETLQLDSPSKKPLLEHHICRISLVVLFKKFSHKSIKGSSTRTEKYK